MKKIMILLCLIVLTSCSIFRIEKDTITEPRLLKQSSLPAVPTSLYNHDFEFYCELVIDEDGNVQRAKMLNGSGDKAWDSLATISLLDWKFTPALLNGAPIKKIIHNKVKVVFVEPIIISLSEILCENRDAADSLYSALLNGKDFGKLAKKYSVSTSREIGGYLGPVDVQFYTKEIRQILTDIKVNEITRPLSYGSCFIIFKRN
jgi:parvulin-like peptidyl-prolyl isomerase